MIATLAIITCIVIFYLIFFVSVWVDDNFPEWAVFPTVMLIIFGGVCSISFILAYVFG